MKRATLILMAVIGAAAALGPGPAGAGTEDDSVVTSHARQGGGYVLKVTAASGQANNWFEDTCGHGSHICVRDTSAGITDDSPNCTQESPTEVQCKLQSLRRVVGDTGDLNDRLSFFERQDNNDAWFMGSGSDKATISGLATVKGGGGADTLHGRRGNQRLLGGDDPDKITGGPGNNDYCDGEGGNDSGGDGCETTVSL